MKTRPCFPVVAALLLATAAAQNTPLRIEQTFEPQFPAALSLSRLSEGEARVVIHVDAAGQLADWLVVSYTDKAFADEAVEALKRWRYTPAAVAGEPVGIRTELEFKFQAKGRVVSLMAIDTPQMLFEQVVGPTQITRVCHPGELDQPLVPVSAVSPFNPAPAPGAALPRRSVLVDFYVDERGQPRMPVAVEASQEILAAAAVGALSQWRFNPPTRAGKPVAVRVRQQFIFPARS